MKLLNKNKNIYFIGIGGIGMSGIAEILYEMNFSISGSDKNENQNTLRLKKLGIKINIEPEKPIKQAKILLQPTFSFNTK